MNAPGRAPRQDDPAPLHERARALRAWIKHDPGGFAARLRTENRRRSGDFLHGLAAWHASPPSERMCKEKNAILWRAGSSRLIDLAPDRNLCPVALLIPSLINRAHVFDLPHRNGFARMLADANWRPVLMDWGEPQEEEAHFNLDSYIKHRLLPALDCAAALDPANAPAVFGYCMGGLLALALASLRPTMTRGLVLLATPWRFTHGDDHHRRASFARILGHSLPCTGIAPTQWIQALLLAERPFSILDRHRQLGARLAARDKGGAGGTSTEARAREPTEEWVALEDWSQDGMGLALPVLRETLIEWYGADAPSRGAWKLGTGPPIHPASLELPVCAVFAEHDRIIPPSMSAPIVEALRRGSVIRAQGGHLGLMLESRSGTSTWPLIRDWLDPLRNENA